MPVQLKVVGYVLLLACAGMGLWYLYHSGRQAGREEVQVQWDADKIQRDVQQKKALIAYANRISLAEVQHDQDQALINQLHDAVGRLRIQLPACPGGAAASGADPDGKSGVLPNRVDESFARLQERAGRLFARCDQLNIDAIRANAAR